MGQTIAAFTMSLDGFIAGVGDDVRQIFKWYGMGDTDFPVPDTNMTFKISRASADLLGEVWPTLGALVTGRRDFDVSHAWGGEVPMGLPAFIVTHNPPQEWLKEGSPFTFVTDGVVDAIARAREAAGDKNIAVSGSQIVQQCLKLGLIDQIHIDLAPILLGDGIRLFSHLDVPIELEYTRVIEGAGVTHLTFRVVK